MPTKNPDFFSAFIGAGLNLVAAADADALVLFLERGTDWEQLAKICGDVATIVVGNGSELLEDAEDRIVKASTK